jgi:hypothetical protein
MRFWRSIGMLALAMCMFTRPTPAAPIETAAPRLAATVVMATAADSALAKQAQTKQPKEKQSPVPNRRSWMFGFSYGFGSANFIGAGEDAFFALPPTGFSDQDREMGPLTQFRFAYAVQPKFALGFERTSWSKKINGDNWSLGATTAMATLYPSAGGWYLRGGFGIADAHDKHVIDAANNINVKYSDDGFAFLGGAGYERRVWKHYSVAIQADYLYGALGPSTAFNYPLGSLGINYWF